MAAHATSLVVWDVPSPVAEGSEFTLKVGVKCSAACGLAGQLVEIQDAAGVRVGGGRLSERPWEGTTGLHWADVALTAPSADQVSVWSAAFSPSALPLAHESAVATFTFRVAKRPDHRARIRVIARDTQSPLRDVEVRLGPYVACTDGSGVAEIDVPAASYEVCIRSDGYDAVPRTIDVNGDVTVQIEATTALTRAQWEEQLNEFRHILWE